MVGRTGEDLRNLRKAPCCGWSMKNQKDDLNCTGAMALFSAPGWTVVFLASLAVVLSAPSGLTEAISEGPNPAVVVCETTKGDIEITVTASRSPIGAARFLELVAAGFYSDVALFRVVKGFLVQVCWILGAQPHAGARAHAPVCCPPAFLGAA
jgi:hypothetical protein